MDNKSALIAQHWSKPSNLPPRTRWWQSETIVRHINKRICGKDVPGTDGGDIEKIKQILSGARLERGISIGCGGAWHELRMLAAGCVDNFDLYELSETRRAQAIASAKAMGLSHRIRFPEGDAFSSNERYDLIYWKDALHHMPSAYEAMAWSHDRLSPSGLFYMNEFVGPTFMQYSDRQLDLAERVRVTLHEKYLRDPRQPTKVVPLRRVRPRLASIKQDDPSECQDSANILPAFRATFPLGTIIPTGGVVYMLAMNDILANFDEKHDADLIKALMLADDFCMESGEYLYAVSWSRA